MIILEHLSSKQTLIHPEDFNFFHTEDAGTELTLNALPSLKRHMLHYLYEWNMDPNSQGT
jgi:hypothetical protein